MKSRHWIVLPILAVCVGCNSLGGILPKKEPVPIVSGSPVKLILMKELVSGQAKEGEDVPLLVVEPVKGPKGEVLIPEGAIAIGKVTWSRGEDAVGAITNRPARLAIDITHTFAADGTRVGLTGDPEKRPGEPFQLNRGNTGRSALAESLSKAWDAEDSKKVLEDIHTMFETGKAPSTLTEAGATERLEEIATEIRSESLGEVARQGKFAEIESMIKDVNNRSPRINVQGENGLVTLSALIQTAEIAGEVGNRLGQVFKGRNIRAHTGTPITAYVTQRVDITLP